MKKIVIGFSGGLDSTTLLGWWLAQGFEVHCCFFLYGSKHEQYEMMAVKNIFEYYKIEHKQNLRIHKFDLRQVFQNFKSSLLKTGNEIPDGHYNDIKMKQTIVPGRNIIMMSIMAGFAESIGSENVSLGVHKGDSYIYPDCRPGFVTALIDAVRESSEGKVFVDAPFLYNTKEEVLKFGYSCYQPSIPYHLTRTCYKNQPVACGKCGSCRERLEAFEKIGIKDPIKYE